MPIPPGTSHLFSAATNANESSFMLYSRDGNGSRVSSGPYRARIVPMSGQLQIAGGKSGILTTVDAHVFFPPEANAVAQDVVVDILRNTNYEVVFVRRWSDSLECYIKRANSR